MSSPSQGVAIALLCEKRESGEHLREMMTALGASIVYESTVSGFDRAALDNSRAKVVVVNLDGEDDPAFDSVSTLLDDDRYEVVFNDAEVSRGLSGWDQARWVRHLAAKISGAVDIDPPRPPGVESVPAPQRRREVPEVAREPAIELPAVAAIDVIEPPSPRVRPLDPPVEPMAVERGTDEWSVAQPSMESAAADSLTDPLIEFEMPSPPVLEQGFAFDIDIDVADAAVVAPADGLTVEVPAVESSAFDLDFDFDLPATEAPAAMADHVVHDMTDSPFQLDIDADEVIEMSGAEPGVPAASMNWALEDALDDLDEVPPAAASASGKFGIETVSPAEYLAPAADEDGEFAQAPMVTSSGVSLELIPLEEAVAPTAVDALDRENWLDPDKIAKSKISRVWVLGASIGGPESVREFLGEFPRDYPALFLLAQHMGDDFVDTMTQQLARSTALTVRMPGHGERAGHGEVLVVPNSQRLLVDRSGVVVLERVAESGAYNPSIDRVLQDVAERFGAAAGAIIFSGMSDDAAVGCRDLAEKGGSVYVQDPASCVVSTMIDGVRETGVVGFLGSPKELAEKLLAERT